MDQQAACKTQGFLVGVSDSSHAGNRHRFENGMSMFYLLSDGTFLVYDGGQGAEDADHLYMQLKRVAAENGIDRITVSAWAITHEHGDHMGFVPHFFPKYKNEITLRELWINPLYPAGERLIACVLENHPTCHVRKLVIGEVFSLADVQVEVLCTPEALAEVDAECIKADNNNASIVTRLTIDGKTVLMSGDAALGAWRFMVARYGERLKSDYLQVPHHGANHGADMTAYSLINADVLLFTCGEELHRTTVTEGVYYFCDPPHCRHNLFNPQTYELVKSFTGKLIVAGAYNCTDPICTKFIG